jgi:hypothetical protein
LQYNRIFRRIGPRLKIGERNSIASLADPVGGLRRGARFSTTIADCARWTDPLKKVLTDQKVAMSRQIVFADVLDAVEQLDTDAQVDTCRKRRSLSVPRPWGLWPVSSPGRA